MSWVKLRPTFADDERWIDAGAAAMAVHIAALCYCDRHLTDGAISATMARRVCIAVHPAEAVIAIEALVALGFWRATESGYQIVGYLDDQIAAEDTLRARARWAADKRWRRQHNAGDHGICPVEKCPSARQMGAETSDDDETPISDIADVPVGHDECPEKDKDDVAAPRPDPTRPDPKGGSSEGGERHDYVAKDGAHASQSSASASAPQEPVTETERLARADKEAETESLGQPDKSITDAVSENDDDSDDDRDDEPVPGSTHYGPPPDMASGIYDPDATVTS